MLVHGIVQHYLLGSLLGMFILAMVGIVTAVYYNDNGWAVELLVVHGVILPPVPEPTNTGLTGNYLTDCCIHCGLLPAGRPGMPEPSILACCCSSCCTDNNNHNNLQRQQSTSSTSLGDTNGNNNNNKHPSSTTTTTPQTPSAATFPILFSNTPQCLWWMSIWRTIGLVHLVTSIWVLYGVLSLSTTWLDYTSGDLRAVLSALHSKVILGGASTFIVCNLPLVWKVVFAPIAWCMCIVPWYCYRVVGDSRVISRPEGYQTSEEREAALREGFYSLTLEAAVQQQRVRESTIVPPAGGGSGAGSPTTSGMGISSGGGGGTRPLSAENVARLQHQQQLHASQLAGLAILNPSKYAASPPSRTYGMGDVSTLSRHAAVHQHNLLSARLHNCNPQSTATGATSGGAVAGAAGGVALSPESLALARQLLGGGGGVAASGSVRSLAGSAGDNASGSITSTTADRSGTIELPFTFGQTNPSTSASASPVATTNISSAQLLFMAKDPDAMESELSFCQRLDQFFVDDCGFCAAFQRQQQDILLATHEQRIRSALAAAGADDAGTDAMMGSAIASKQARRVVGFDSTVEDQSLQKAHRKKDKDKKSKEKRSKEKKETKSKSKEKKDKSKKSKKHGRHSDDDDDDDDDDPSAPEPRPDTANPLLARSTSTVASEINSKKAKRDKNKDDDDASSRATSPSSKKSKKKDKKDKKKKKDKHGNGIEESGDLRGFSDEHSDGSDDDDIISNESRSTFNSVTGGGSTGGGVLPVLDFTNTSPKLNKVPDLQLDATSNSLRGSQMLGGSSGKFSPKPAGSDYGDDHSTGGDHHEFQRVVSSQSMPSLGLNTIRSNTSGDDGVAAFESALAKLSTKHTNNNHNSSLSDGTLLGVNNVSSRRRSISNSRHSDATAISPRSSPLVDKDEDGNIKRSGSKAISSSKKEKEKKDKSSLDHQKEKGISSSPQDTGFGTAVARTKSEKADKKANKEKKRKEKNGGGGGESEGNVFASFDA